jgi:trehalose 6-phosphate synthase/phosphatase
LVNPYNVHEVAQALGEELEREHPDSTHMLEFVNENTSGAWAERFLTRLEATSAEAVPVSRPLEVGRQPLATRIRTARYPLVLLDYDGTLRSYERKPEDATPSRRARLILSDLAKHAAVYVISGRSADTLEQWLGDLPIGLVCEHGFAMREVGRAWEERGTPTGQALRRLLPLLEEFARRTPGAFVERKRSAIAWHYRSAEPEFGAFQARELLNELEEMLRRRPFAVLRGNRVIEVRHAQTSKGHAAEEILRRHRDADFVLCAGDDRTDEDMMEAVERLRGEEAVRCWVGGRHPLATHWTESSASLLDQLSKLADSWAKRSEPPGPPANSETRVLPRGRRKTADVKGR